ncbi:MAG: xylulokinase, partial [Anaerolineae bacterium]|nr:xylulokinase [Anaerolineae bacterium]
LGLHNRPDAYTHLSALAAQTPPGAEGLIFLPYLAGERTPHFDPDASGLFLGLRLHHHAGHLARAVMEGVTFALADCLALMPEPPAWVIASGGASSSPVWLQIQADVFNRPLTLVKSEHHACVGAALLAGVSSGVYASIQEACNRLPQGQEAAFPNTTTSAFYAERRAQFAALYDLLRTDMHTLRQK